MSHPASPTTARPDAPVVGSYTPAPTAASRITSIDILRGIVMVLMAIDHVRVYAGVPAGGPAPAVFFTRWVTHFCAPLFFFLAGTSAFLYARRHQDTARFLATRGALLVLLELTVIRCAWTFNLDFRHYMLAGVIWALGWSMILLAAMTRLSPRTVGIIGVAIVALHNALGGILATPALGPLGTILYAGFSNGPIGPLTVLYVLIPWVGVMAAGYGFGVVMTQEPARRDALCLRIGLGATLLFVVLRTLGVYGDPSPWRAQQDMPPVLAFLNTTKYPASLLFLLMTLGPGIAALPLLERMRGAAARVLETFGRVPFFYYLLHIPLIHALALVVSLLRTGGVNPWLFANHPTGNGPPPVGYRWSLALLYLTWAVAVALLYPACRWYARVKAQRAGGWTRYL